MQLEKMFRCAQQESHKNNKLSFWLIGNLLKPTIFQITYLYTEAGGSATRKDV